MARVGVVGWPVEHSRSPKIFAHWFERYGIDAAYELIPVPPRDAEAFFAALPEDYAGVNVTLPHKETAARFVELEGQGARLNVVNTLWREDGVVRGTSSDGAGFLASLDAAHAGWAERGGTALVLGAGGAAAAVVDALQSRGLSVVVANRTAAKAKALAQRLAALTVPFEGVGDALADVRLLVNTTSLGMAGAPDVRLPLERLPGDAVVADIVYNPIETGLLREARAAGLKTVDGLGMLLHQATVGFERWFGIAPEVDCELRRAVLATL